MLSDEEKQIVLDKAIASVQEARDNDISEDVFIDTLKKDFEFLGTLHKQVCFSPDCNMEERQNFSIETIKAEFAKEYIPTPKMTDEVPLSFEERKSIRTIVTARAKQAVANGISKEDFLKTIDEDYKLQNNEHKKKCATIPCALDESYDLMKEVVEEIYLNKTSLSVEEILKLAEEKGVK